MTAFVFDVPQPAAAPIVLLGWSRAISPSLDAGLRLAGYRIVPVVCELCADDPAGGDPAVTLDQLQDGRWCVPPGAIVLSLLPLWELQPLLPMLRGVQRIIAFSSTSCCTRGDDGAVTQDLVTAEKALRDFAGCSGVSWTILRPTMIYAPPHDTTVTELARAMRRWPVLPLAGWTRGLCQPVHTEDLTNAVLAVLRSGASWDRAFDLGGGEVLSFRQMARRVARALGRRILFLPVSSWLLPGGPLPGGSGEGETPKRWQAANSALLRMDQDMVFDNGPAMRAFGYRPRPFQPRFPEGF